MHVIGLVMSTVGWNLAADIIGALFVISRVKVHQVKLHEKQMRFLKAIHAQGEATHAGIGAVRGTVAAAAQRDRS